jgi:hypothetical protein
MERIRARKLGSPGQTIFGEETSLRANANCEDWKVPSDHSSGHLFEEWELERQRTSPVRPTTAKDLDLMEQAWKASITHHTATLRRIGWIDQKGRVWLEVPATADFDGGSLTPLLVDVRES